MSAAITDHAIGGRPRKKLAEQAGFARQRPHGIQAWQIADCGEWRRVTAGRGRLA